MDRMPFYIREVPAVASSDGVVEISGEHFDAVTSPHNALALARRLERVAKRIIDPEKLVQLEQGERKAS